MARVLIVILLIPLLITGIGVQPAYADGGTYTVQPGDTLLKIARTYDIDVGKLAAANGLRWNSWVYTGQQLVIPDDAGQNDAATSDATADAATVYIVKAGDTLYSIARRHATTVADLRTANNLAQSNLIYTGQRLVIRPGTGEQKTETAVEVPAPPPSHGTNGEKWIDVNLSTQTVVAYEGRTPVYRTLASTGTSRYPTVTGTYRIYVKYRSARMRGGSGADYYDFPNVPYVMYFYSGYGLHGTYWHDNFGTPMSHGCVNLSITAAEWIYNWASVGTKVVTHY